MKSLNLKTRNRLKQSFRSFNSPQNQKVLLDRQPVTGNRIPATARPFHISRLLSESSSSSNRSKKLVWDGPRGPRQRSLSRARRGMGRRIFRSVKYSTRGMLDYNRRFGLKISNSDPHIWRSSVFSLGSCNFSHWTQDTEHGTHHHHPHHHHSGFHDHHEGHFSWFFNWRRGGINPYWVCTLTFKAGKIAIGHARPAAIHPSRRERHYHYASGAANPILYRNPQTKNPKPETENRPHNQDPGHGTPFHRTPDTCIPKLETDIPKQYETRPGHFWSSQKTYCESRRDPYPAGIKLKKTKPALHLVVPKRVSAEESKPIAAKPKTQDQEHKTIYMTLGKASESKPGSRILNQKPNAPNSGNNGSKTRNPKPETEIQRSAQETINRTTGKASEPKPSSWTADQKPKTSKSDNSRPETARSKPETQHTTLVTGNWQPETHMLNIPSSLPLRSPFKVVGAAALPE